MTVASIPIYEPDLFDDASSAAPYEHYRAMRDLGPVVWSAPLQMYVIARYVDVRAALRADGDFISGDGVSFNDLVNEAQGGTTIASDGDVHKHLRSIVSRGLTPRALQQMTADVEQIAGELVDRALEQGSIDAVEMLGTAMPLKVVPDLLGWEAEVRPKLMDWGAAAFNAVGPMNSRCQAALPKVMEMIKYAQGVAEEGRVAADSLGAGVLRSAERGEVRLDQCPGLMLDYLTPSLDTTASALGAAFHLFSVHPEQWRALREDPSLVGNAINEIVRWQTPIRFFTRVAARDVAIDGTVIPVGSRVILVFASANRDERHWTEPDEFDVRRQNASTHVGFGFGVHGCVGQGLTRLEAQALFAELLRRVERFEPAGEATLAPGNVIRAYESVPVTLIPA